MVGAARAVGEHFGEALYLALRTADVVVEWLEGGHQLAWGDGEGQGYPRGRVAAGLESGRGAAEGEPAWQGTGLCLWPRRG